MLYTLRGIAILMLVAGVSLGVFASTLIADQPAPIRPKLEQRIEEQLKLYRNTYNLDEEQTGRIRRELLRHQRQVLKLLFRLRQENEQHFRDIQAETQERISGILER